MLFFFVVVLAFLQAVFKDAGGAFRKKNHKPAALKVQEDSLHINLI